MGLFDSIASLIDDTDGDDGGSGTDDRPATDGADATPQGANGHWGALVPIDDEDDLKRVFMEAVDDGETSAAADAVAYRDGVPVGALVVAAESGQIVTGFPVADGVEHRATLDCREVAEHGHEAYYTWARGSVDVSFFATNQYALDGPAEGDRRVSLAALAYTLGPVDAAAVAADGTTSFETADTPAVIPMEGRGVDDYVLLTTVESVAEREFRGTTVYQLRVPLVDGEDGTVDVSLYAGEHVLGEYVPAEGDDVLSAVWLQGEVLPP